MKKLIGVLVGLWLAAPLLLAQTGQPKALTLVPLAAAEAPVAPAPPEVSALDGELFYQLLLGEMTTQDNEPAAGYALILDAARKTNDAQLYQRATDIALQSRSGDSALQAARAWRLAQPAAREPNRYELQILIALNRISDTIEPLKAGIELAPVADRSVAIGAIPRAYARATDKKLVSTVVEEALAAYFKNPATASAAWTTAGRMRLAAGDVAGSMDAVKKARAADESAEAPAWLALELMDKELPGAEALVKKHLANNVKALPEMRMGYARALLDAQRYSEATDQLQSLIRDQPSFEKAWLALGSLQLQDNQLAAAQTSLERYVAMVQPQTASAELNRSLAQAYLSLSQIAEKRKDFAAAEGWIGKIDNADDMIQAQTRRASILASQGKLAEGRALIRQLPEQNPGDARLKLTAEIGLLRELKQYPMAHTLLAESQLKFPDDSELIYDQAMMAEKINLLPQMERLLRRVIELKPDHHHAYNALGYSLADRKVRLPEARELIRKALYYAPTDPFIRDSLGWVEFRMGNQTEALKIFAEAFKAKPDAEIAAHFGEVLWTAGQRDKALAIWREGQLLNPESETLMETLKRLRVKL